MKSIFRFFSFALAICFSTTSFAQLIINPNGGITPVQAVEDVLLGAGVNAFNITYNGSAANAQAVQAPVQEFNAGASAFPIPAGVHMTTSGAPGITDADLAAIVSGTVTNGVIIEFDFIPDGSLINFNYIFASAEYSGYTCSGFNDGFGFFISGPGINGPFTNNAINIATVPNTNVPVAINTVNSGTPSSGNGQPCFNADPNWQQNSVYFTTSNNPIFNSTSQVTNYNGSTVVMPAVVQVECNEVYHIKLAVCNVSDQILDSGVFLEAGSFQSDNVNISISTNNAFADTLIYRNCSEGVISFDRLSCDLNEILTIYIDTDGTAVEGVDYEVLPDSVVFNAGEDNISFNIVPITSAVNLDPESIIITVYFIDEFGDTISATGTIWIVDPPLPEIDASNITLLCFEDSVAISAWVTEPTFPPFVFTWYNGVEGDTIFENFNENGTYFFPVEMLDGCGQVVFDTAVVVVNQTLNIDTLMQFPSECGLATGAVSAMVSGTSGTPLHTWTTAYPNYTFLTNATVAQNLPSGWYVYTVADAVCSATDSIFVEQDPPPTAAFTPNPAVGNAPLDVTFINNSQGASTYYWDFANGNDLTINNTSSQNQTYTEEGNYLVMLVATEGACSDTAYQLVVVNLLLPLFYDMPNIFTPNGDGTNDFFTINPENAVELDMVIVNRWGNVVFESNDVNAVWNGRNRNDGAECSPGTYFYKFRIVGMDGEEKTEHGFVQLVRD